MTAASLWAPAAGEGPPADSDLGTDIVHALAFQDQLWVLGESSGNGSRGGAVVTFTLPDGVRKLRLRGTIALEKAGDRLFALTSDGVLEWKTNAFAALPAPALEAGETPTALLPIGDEIGLETSEHLFVLEGTSWRALARFKRTAPKDPFDADAFVSAKGMPASAKTLYTGFNKGEWGGGLGYRDLASGAAGKVRDAASMPTDGNPKIVSDNVNAIIADPARDDCVIVAAGLVHFMASGALLRACGDTATLFFSSAPRTLRPAAAC